MLGARRLIEMILLWFGNAMLQWFDLSFDRLHFFFFFFFFQLNSSLSLVVFYHSHLHSVLDF